MGGDAEKSETICSMKLNIIEILIIQAIQILCVSFYENQLLSSFGRSTEELMHYPFVSASTFMLDFYKSLYFSNHLMNWVHIWYGNRYIQQYPAMPLSNVLLHS